MDDLKLALDGSISCDYDYCLDHHRYEIRDTHTPISGSDLVKIEDYHESFRNKYCVDSVVGF